MGKGSLSIETMIVIVICLFVLILSILYVTRMTAPVTNGTISTATLYSECNNWRLFGYSTDRFSNNNYPALFNTYGSSCFDEKGKLKSECQTDKTKTDPIALSAKNFCTMEQTNPNTAEDTTDAAASSGGNTVTANTPSEACIELGFNDGNCNQNCASGYTEKGTAPCSNGRKLCCK